MILFLREIVFRYNFENDFESPRLHHKPYYCCCCSRWHINAFAIRTITESSISSNILFEPSASNSLRLVYSLIFLTTYFRAGKSIFTL